MGVTMCGEVCSAKMHFHSEPAFAAMHASLTPLVEFMYCAHRTQARISRKLLLHDADDKAAADADDSARPYSEREKA